MYDIFDPMFQLGMLCGGVIGLTINVIESLCNEKIWRDK